MLTDKKRKYFRRILEKKWDGLSSVKNRSVNDDTIRIENLPDPMNKATSESGRTFNLTLRERENEMIHKIRDALERLDNGMYGICEDCGEEIATRRLRVRPEARLCIHLL